MAEEGAQAGQAAAHRREREAAAVDHLLEIALDEIGRDLGERQPGRQPAAEIGEVAGIGLERVPGELALDRADAQELVDGGSKGHRIFRRLRGDCKSRQARPPATGSVLNGAALA